MSPRKVIDCSSLVLIPLAHLMHERVASFAGQKLVLVGVDVVVAAGAPLHRPLHAHGLVAQRLGLLRRFLERLGVLPVRQGLGARAWGDGEAQGRASDAGLATCEDAFIITFVITIVTLMPLARTSCLECTRRCCHCNTTGRRQGARLLCCAAKSNLLRIPARSPRLLQYNHHIRSRSQNYTRFQSSSLRHLRTLAHAESASEVYPTP